MTGLVVCCILIAVGILFAPAIEAAMHRQRINGRVRRERNVVVLIDCEDCASHGWAERSLLSDDPRTDSCARCGGTHFTRVGAQPDAETVQHALDAISSFESRHKAAVDSLRLACGLEPEA